jgi:hypothetical protein
MCYSSVSRNWRSVQVSIIIIIIIIIIIDSDYTASWKTGFPRSAVARGFLSATNPILALGVTYPHIQLPVGLHIAAEGPVL